MAQAAGYLWSIALFLHGSGCLLSRHCSGSVVHAFVMPLPSRAVVEVRPPVSRAGKPPSQRYDEHVCRMMVGDTHVPSHKAVSSGTGTGIPAAPKPAGGAPPPPRQSQHQQQPQKAQTPQQAPKQQKPQLQPQERIKKRGTGGGNNGGRGGGGSGAKQGRNRL